MKPILDLWRRAFHDGRELLLDSSLLLLRVAFGLMMAIGHGWGKYKNFDQIVPHFKDFLGIGAAGSLAMATFAELVCSILLVLGVATRFAAFNLVATMTVAAFVAHWPDPFFTGPGVPRAKEMAVLYLVPFLAILLAGPGRFSVDHLVAKKLYRDEPAEA